jgi:hypothetical protein
MVPGLSLLGAPVLEIPPPFNQPLTHRTKETRVPVLESTSISRPTKQITVLALARWMDGRQGELPKHHISAPPISQHPAP